MNPQRAWSRRHCLTALLLAPWAAARSVVATAPTADDAIDLDFGAFFRRPVGPRGLEPSAALRAAAGRRVRLRGYMVVREDREPGRFQLAPLPVRLSEHADGDASDLPPQTVTVLLDPGQRERVVVPRPGPMTLVGRLDLGRQEDERGRVTWLRLQLDADAVAAAPSPAAVPTAAAAGRP